MSLSIVFFLEIIYIHIYIEECIFRKPVIIQARFVKDERASIKDMGQFLYHQDPDNRKIIKRLEKLKSKIINKQ